MIDAIEEYRPALTVIDEGGLGYGILDRLKEQRYKELEQDEARLAELMKYESEMQATLVNLETRLDTVEKELAHKGSAKK